MVQVMVLDPVETRMDMLVVPVWEGSLDIHGHPAVRSLVQEAKAWKEFTGAENDEMVFFRPQGLPANQVLVIGVGKAESLSLESFRKAAGKAIRKSISKEVSSVVFAVPDFDVSGIGGDEILVSLLEGAVLGSYQFQRYKKPKHPSITDIGFWVSSENVDRYAGLAKEVQTVCEGTLLAREWVNLASNHKRPDRFVDLIQKEIQHQGIESFVTVEVLDEPALLELGFGAMLAVGAGSDSPPHLMILDYHPEQASVGLGLIGKGVTFDSGGINLKSATSLEDMKMDMSGAAAVAAALITAARLKFPRRIVAALPLVENMPSGSATRPGDIITTFSGKTVEIGNTDAEGRLILADTISYLKKRYNPDLVLDLATLTGACVVGLGERIAGLFSNDRELSDVLMHSSRVVGERCWPMPLPEDYQEFLKSEHADICNKSSSKGGGAITAALFLMDFVADTRWAHIDIAGPAWINKDNAYCGAGGTGFGVRLLIDFLKRWK